MIDPGRLRMPTVSGEGMAVLRLLENDQTDALTVARAIGLDPVLSSTLLRYANSPAHRRAREATTVQQAINVLGLRQVRAAVVVATMRGFCGDDPVSFLLWEQGLAISTLARAIAVLRFPALADEVELLGLLHNLGAQVLNCNFPDVYRDLLEGALQDGMPVQLAEREMFGLHRGDLLPLLADRFHLPQRVQQVLAAFHARQVPQEAETPASRALACLWLAQAAASLSPAAANWPPVWQPHELPALMQLVDLDQDSFLNLTEDCEALVSERLAA